MPQVPQALHHRSRDRERTCARGRDFCVSRRSADRTGPAGSANGAGDAGRPPSRLALGIAFWTLLTLVASALPVELPRGTQQAVALAPLVAAMALGGPAVGGWVAAIGTTEMRELRGRIPWYGTLANHAGCVLPVIAAGVVRLAVIAIARPTGESEPVVDFVATVIAASVFFVAQRRDRRRRGRASDGPVASRP